MEEPMLQTKTSRRQLLGSGAAAIALVGTAVPAAFASASSDLARLIEDHRVAYRAFCNAIDREQKTEAADFGLAGAKRDLKATSEAEEEATIAVCAYQCRALEEARLKAAYLAEAPGLSDGLQPEHIEALLQSFRSIATA
jgi:hypothetical protein